MSYRKNLIIYRIKDDSLNIPLVSNLKTYANGGNGSLILIEDDKVWVKNWNDDAPDEYVLAGINPDFIRVHSPKFFEKE